jgi:NADPH-dependent ferric siderophore reductase
LAGQSLVGLTSLPAQDIEVILNGGLGPPVKRRYTIRTLRSAVDGFALPSWEGRAYLLGEGQTVGVLRDALEARGLERDRIFAKGYWGARSALQQERSA